MKPSKRTRHPRGFTLLEAMIAAVIFLTGMVGILQMLGTSQKTTALGRKEMWANGLANDLVGQIALWAYDDTRLSATSADPCASDPADSANALQTDAANALADYLGCAHGDTDLTSATFNGVASSVQPDGVTATRFYMVREEARDGSVASANQGARKRIWVVVAYTVNGESVGRRVVSYLTKYNPRFP